MSEEQIRKTEISFKAGINYALSCAIQNGCLSTVNGKHGIHIPDELYSELKEWRISGVNESSE